MAVSEYLSDQTVFLQLESREKVGALREMLAAVSTAGAFAESEVSAFLDQFMEREKLGSTGIGRGMAIPHIKSDKIEADPTVAIGVSEAGIEFSSIDGEPVHTLFMILSPTERAAQHLEILKGISALARDRDFCRLVRRMNTAEDIRLLIRDLEEGNDG
ncbi:MAG: PTS sugar transporter subunit IIA [Planctomycetota bacterium]